MTGGGGIERAGRGGQGDKRRKGSNKANIHHTEREKKRQWAHKAHFGASLRAEEQSMSSLAVDIGVAKGDVANPAEGGVCTASLSHSQEAEVDARAHVRGHLEVNAIRRMHE